jgi:hypothetical protein
MRISGGWLRRQIAGCLLLVLGAPFLAAAASPQQATNASQDAETTSSAQTQSQQPRSDTTKLNAPLSQTEALPDSPGSLRFETIAENRAGSGQQSPPQGQQNSTQQSSSQPQQNTAQQPAGTAAAGSIKATGVAASQPAGAAIAPAKQRRTRSILIKVGALVGAGVAVGTVVALSSASPSRPR